MKSNELQKTTSQFSQSSLNIKHKVDFIGSAAYFVDNSAVPVEIGICEKNFYIYRDIPVSRVFSNIDKVIKLEDMQVLSITHFEDGDYFRLRFSHKLKPIALNISNTENAENIFIKLNLEIQSIITFLNVSIREKREAEIFYSGGTSPGESRRVKPIKIFNTHLRAICLRDGKVKSFKFIKINLDQDQAVDAKKA